MITAEQRLALEEKVIEMLRTVYDPEIPVDVYSLGLIYKIDIDDDANLHIDMTLTAPNCPAADFIVEDMRIKLESIEGINSVDINIVFEPEWDKDMPNLNWDSYNIRRTAIWQNVPPHISSATCT
jgi:metal-sulfur cluster biosynthetic enzyme